MNLAGKNYSREALLRRCNNLSALYGARRVTLEEGKAAGVRAVEVWTAGGLRVLFNCDRCLDPLELSYKGVNISYLTANGINSNAQLDVADLNQDFGNYWIGGMLTTCGMRNTGNSCEWQGELLRKQGTVGITPAENVNITVDDETITLTGIMRETSLYRCDLELFRTIRIPVDGAKIFIRDEIRNNTPKEELLFYMYHINFAFPFLDEGLELTLPEAGILPRDAASQAAIADSLSITPPQDDASKANHCFFRHVTEENVSVGLCNHSLGIKATVSYSGKELPWLIQWKSMCSGNYVLGIEPGTSRIRGCKAEAEDGYDVKVKPFGQASYHVELQFADL